MEANEEAGQKKKKLEITELNDSRQEESSKGHISGVALEGLECIRIGCVTSGLLPPTCSIVTSHLEGDQAIDSVGSHVSRLNYTLIPPTSHRLVILVYLTKPLF